MNNMLIFSTVGSTRMFFLIHPFPKKCCFFLGAFENKASQIPLAMGGPWWGGWKRRT